MTTLAALTARIEFEPTAAGLAGAREKLDTLAAQFGEDDRGSSLEASAPESPAPEASVDEAPRAVYRSTGEDARTRELLDVLPGDSTEALTPTEIGKRLTPNDDGSALSSAQVRAVMRNEKRIERTLKNRGVIAEDREVLKADFSRYGAEGCGRYYLSAADREVIQTL